MPTIGNTSLPYYSQNNAVNATKQSQSLQKPSAPLTVLKADPPPSVELTKPPSLDVIKPSSLDLETEIQKSQGIDLSKLETPAQNPTSISSLNPTELQELKSLGSEKDSSNSDAISKLKTSLAQSSITSL